MKFSIGDKVVMKHTGEEGVVTAYINTHMVEVEVAGITFPVHVDELDHPYLKWFTEKKQKVKKVVPEQIPVEKKKAPVQRLSRGIYLSFIPEFKLEEMEDVVDHLKIHLLNETAKKIRFSYDVVYSGRSRFSHEGVLQPFTHIYLHNIPYDDMNEQPRFNWQLDDLEDADMQPASGTLRIRPQKLFQHISQVLTDNLPSFNYLLIEDFTPHSIQQPKEPAKKMIVEHPPAQSYRAATAYTLPDEIDLHVENLTGNTRGMSNADIIQLQLSALQTYLRQAINAHKQRVVIIHGLGKGKLKDEVHNLLKSTPEVKSFANEWHGRYGFGATEVWFSY